MTQEHDAVEIVNLTLQQVGHLPDVRNSREIGQHLTIGLASAVARHAIATNLSLGNLLHRATLVGLGILKDIDTA